jgi:Caspase domain
MPTAPAKATRWALLIGIDRYPNFPEHAQLAGCVNDVEAMAALLINLFSFPAGNVERLLDGAATQAGIRAAFGSLTERVGLDDVVVVQYSGHGSRMADPKAPDGMDETIVPGDSGRAPHENRDICDTEIHRWLLRLTERTGHLTLIFDSCHSGHILRDPFGAKGRWVEPDPRPAGEASATMAPSVPQRRRDADPGGPGGEAGTDGAGSYRLPLSSKYVLLAGCRSTETSFEVLAQEAGGIQHGALTYFLCQELAKAGAVTTFRDVFEVAAPQVTARYPSQHPQLEGARDLQVFGISELEPMRFVPARQGAAGGVTLAAGAACGMSEGSAWLVYPPGTKSLASGARPQARLEVTRVRALESDARLLEGEVGAGGGRAVEHTHRYSEARFDVEIDAGAKRLPDAVAALRSGVAASPLLSLHHGEGTAAARVYLLPARGGAVAGDAVPAAGALTADSWAVVGADGELSMPVHAAAEPGVVGLLLENLEKRARYRAAMELADPGGPLSGRVQLAVLGREGERWVERGVDEQGVTLAEPIFRAGERIAFQIAHCHPSPLYFYLLDFGLSGAISLVYPAMGGEQKAASRDAATRVGTEEGEEITLTLPVGFPYGGGRQARQTGWVETVKLFATTEEADFGALVQRTVRDAPPPLAESPLSRLLRTSLTGHGTREMEVARPAAAGDWTVVQRSFRLLP